MKSDEHWLSASEAAARLGVKRETLYAYASRGELERHGSGRASRYAREDVERLRSRHDARAGHTAVAAGALRFGQPVLDSAITAIDERGPRYRGHVAAELARRGTSFESVAELLWTGTLPEISPRWPGIERKRARPALPANAPALVRAAATLPLLALADSGRYGASPDAELERARKVVTSLVARDDEGGPIAACIARNLDLAPRKPQLGAIDAALVLIADHELNPSTFAARIAASTGADLYSCLGSALGVLSGPLHGAACERVEALLAEIERPARAAHVLDERARRGEAIPGFGHPLYPDGDPRARLLLDLAGELAPKRLATLFAVEREMRSQRADHPNVDFALVGLTLALGVPLGRAAAAELFLAGRLAGWIAHVLEQRAAGYILRPRARYTGP